MPDLSIVIPTAGRAGLAPLLESIREQATPDDVEIVVVGDIFQDDFSNSLDWAASLCQNYRARYAEHNGGLHCYGQPQRNYGQRIARGEWLAYSQDDNVYTPGAIRTMLEAVRDIRKPRPLLFRVMTRWGFAVWDQPNLAEGHIDADCIVVPRKPRRMGTWQNRYNGDWDFIEETVRLWDGKAEFRQEIIASHQSRVEALTA